MILNGDFFFIQDVKSEYDFLFEYVGQLATENGWVDVNSAPMRKKAIMERQSKSYHLMSFNDDLISFDIYLP